jgi:hypothetical protein
MDKLIVISILIFTCFCSRAQNLVPNNGFDIYTTCPNTGSQFNLTPPWSVLNNTIGSPDYFNACDTVGTQGVPTNNFGYQQAVSNSGYYGLITYFEHNELREYLTVPLISPLAPGKIYTIGFYVSLSDSFKYASDHIGAYLSIGAITGSGGFQPEPYLPQLDNSAGSIISDTINWTLITGTYTALGGEDHLTIGSFSNDANTQLLVINPSSIYEYAYYYLDEVFVISLSPNIIGNNIICIGDSVTLLATNDTQYTWADSSGSVLSTDSVLTVAPIVTTTYYIYGTIDTVEFTVYVYPNPTIQVTPTSITIVRGSSTTLTASGAAGYEWSTGDSTATITVGPDSTTTYWVTGMNSQGCIDSTSVTVTTTRYKNIVYLPNVFSPFDENGDNQALQVFGSNIAAISLVIYDRWGEQVYESTDASESTRTDGKCCAYGKGWDGSWENNGTKINAAAFAYILRGRFTDGEEFEKQGNITLIK